MPLEPVPVYLDATQLLYVLLLQEKDGAIRRWQSSPCVRPLCRGRVVGGLPATVRHRKRDYPSSPHELVVFFLFWQIRVWKITSGKVEAEAQMPSRTTHLRFSPDGKGLAAGMVGGQVRFLTSDTLQPLAQVG